MSLALLKELNKFRTDPKAYGLEMCALTKQYKGKTLTFPSGACMETLEGVQALNCLLDDLSRASPLPGFLYSLPISRACKAHLEDLQLHDFYSHIGTDGSTPEGRVSWYGRHREQCGENIAFTLSGPKEIVWHMLIDDGCPERGHRGNLLNMDFNYIGIAQGFHPSANHCAVIVFVDHFKPKRSDAAEKMATLASEIKIAKGSGRWNDIVRTLRPNHLKCSAEQEDSLNRLVLPNHSVWGPHQQSHQQSGPPLVYMGPLIPCEQIDPSKVRAFVHRLDADFDDSIVEEDVLKVCKDMPCTGGEAPISPLDVREMFDDILATRAPTFHNKRGIVWSELYSALEVKRVWDDCVDVICETCSGSEDSGKNPSAEKDNRVPENMKRCFVFGRRELEYWARHISANHDYLSGLHRLPPIMDPLRKPCHINDMRLFLRSCVNVIADHITFRQEFAPFFQLPPTTQIVTLDVPSGKKNLRQMWIYRTQRHRHDWLRIVKAVGCNPLCPLPPELQARKRHWASPMAHVVEPRPLTLSRAAGKNIAATRSLATNKVTIRPIRGKITIHSKRPEDCYPTSEAIKAGILELLPPHKAANEPAWEEKRKIQEDGINEVLNSVTKGGDSTNGAHSSSASNTQVVVSVDARRRFLASMQKQERASDEAKFLCRKQGVDVSNISGSELTRSTGSGAFSLEAPDGVGGHFHSSVAQQQSGRSNTFPIEQDKTSLVQWNGCHIDHTLSPYVFEDTPWCSLSAAQKNNTYTTYPNPKLRHLTPRKTKVAVERKDIIGPWQEYQEHEFRADVPLRHGRFGQRHFDPQVDVKPVYNAGNVGEIETKPMAEYIWQQERYQNYIDHHVSDLHEKAFQQNLPKAQAPIKWESFVTRTPLLDCVVGDRLHSQIAWGQNRHSDLKRDIKFSMRPLRATTMDKLIDLAPVAARA
eukprot:GEMP01008234.1.p1 GENE.GEMP01008234.1~~GEMP01008234.1.p1  ORF type:complete len:928 (+),score=196.73 GEMP01008234.1:39-2822(+)